MTDILPWKGDMAYCPNCRWREFYPWIGGMGCPTCGAPMDIYHVEVVEKGGHSKYIAGGGIEIVSTTMSASRIAQSGPPEPPSREPYKPWEVKGT